MVIKLQSCNYGVIIMIIIVIMNQSRQSFYHHTTKQSTKASLSQKPSKYIGMTLKQYFKLQTKQQLDEIDEQQQSQLSIGTPTFNHQRITSRKVIDIINNQRKDSYDYDQQNYIKQTIKNNNNHSNYNNNHKMKKDKNNNNNNNNHNHNNNNNNNANKVLINLEQVIKNQKEFIKLPSIHQQKNKSVSIHFINKDQKSINQMSKDNHQKIKYQENSNHNLNLLLKKDDIFKNHITKNLIMNSRRGIQSRVTAISFYQHNHNNRQNARQRAKTQQEIESAVKKSFVITRYGMMGRSNKQDLSELKKYQKSYKVKKN